ncbi:MAG: aminoacyltransferase [Candidatus Moranbacteria bacterium]|nr:aminoacyltransferase [Candidatus Moranbacteria bacterium]
MDFLQSEAWRKFQEAAGRKTSHLEGDGFSVSIIEHQLPIVGKYLYVPKGPVASLEGEEFPISNNQFPIKSQFPISNDQIKCGMRKLIDLAKKENAGWIRIEPADKKTLESIKENISEKVIKAPHDMQPRELFVLDIARSPEQLLTEMKTKTRYNIGIAMKKGVTIDHSQTEAGKKNKELYLHAFLRLTKEMAERHGIAAHSEEYYQKMVESLPDEMLRIYVAKFEDKIIAANLVLFYGDTAVYLHGASGSLHRNLMAPFSLQWQAILDAKELGYAKYDFGGVRIQDTKYKIQNTNKWEGITTFKTGFSPRTKPVVFPGSYDIIINPRKYWAYRGLQAAKSFAVKFRK